MRWKAILVLALVGLPAAANAQYLFVGLESSTPVTRSSDLEGFPEVEYQDHFAFDVSGAAATPEGLLYLCNGAFTTRLYQATLTETPQLLSTISVDISALAYGNDTLYGFSNYADPKGIYAIDPVTGQATLVLDVYSGTGFRFFALDFNQADGLLYGYTEYGDSGLYSINLDTGEMIDAVWQRWLEHDPVTLADRHAAALASLRTYWIDCGRWDEHHLQLGARIYCRVLRELEVPHTYEEFDGGHRNTAHRYDSSLRAFSAAWR